MRFCGPLLIALLLLLCLPAQAQVERNKSNLTSRHRAGSSSRGGWINPGGNDGKQVWTYRQELAVRRVFRSITADGSAALAMSARLQSGTQSIVARIESERQLPPTRPRFSPERASEPPEEQLPAEAAADLPTEPEQSAEPAAEDPAAPQEAALDNPVDDPALQELPDPESALAEDEEDEADSPLGRDFRIRRDPDGSRHAPSEFDFPEEESAEAEVEAADELTQDADAVSPDSPAADFADVDSGFIPDRSEPQPAVLRPTTGKLAIPGTQAAPLAPRLGNEGSGLPHYEIRADLQRISRGNSKLRQVALTFDDGPHPEYTGQLLAILEYYNAPATFFFVGVQANRHPQWLQMTHQQGHEIASQTYDHFRMPKLPLAEKEYQIDAYQDLVADLTGDRPRFLRPPGGQLDDTTMQLLKERGMVCALWDVALNDTTAGRTRDQMLEHALAEVRNGSVILAHDGIQATIDLLPELIETLREEGYELVTMSQLASGI